MAEFTYIPDFGASKKKKPKVNAIKFGDSYEQRATFGINNDPSEWDLTFSMRKDDEINAIDAFLSARAGVESFYWTPYGESSQKFICREWTKTLDHYNLSTITAKFEQVYEL